MAGLHAKQSRISMEILIGSQRENESLFVGHGTNLAKPEPDPYRGEGPFKQEIWAQNRSKRSKQALRSKGRCNDEDSSFFPPQKQTQATNLSRSKSPVARHFCDLSIIFKMVLDSSRHYSQSVGGKSKPIQRQLRGKKAALGSPDSSIMSMSQKFDSSEALNTPFGPSRHER